MSHDGLAQSQVEHSNLTKAIIEQFAPHFFPNSTLIYAPNKDGKTAYFDQAAMIALGVKVDSHGKMPDVVVYCKERNWLILIEAITGHGPIDEKRRKGLSRQFSSATVGLIYVTAFPSRSMMERHVVNIAWETDVWVADAPSHLIHFNGCRFLGPYGK